MSDFFLFIFLGWLGLAIGGYVGVVKTESAIIKSCRDFGQYQTDKQVIECKVVKESK